MNQDRAQIVESLQKANNVLITVNKDPTVDELAACIGFTLLLNKLSKHATAVFSGDVPSTLEFLKPEDTLEKNTDSLRDFIIALDKSKADKLRYKVEDTMVKIFITPYKTSISDEDLEFSQGDFNVDVVLALGIHEREQVDNAIMGHGRILHDAVVMSADNKVGNNIGTINWVNEQASSLCEMLATVAEELQPQSMDAQIATALLTGIVSETERFSNQKTSSATMEVSSKLMAAGADQQLVATKLEPEEVTVQTEPPKTENPIEEENDDGSIVIDHSDEEKAEPEPQQNESVEEAVPDEVVPPTQYDVDNSEDMYQEPEPEPEPEAMVVEKEENLTAEPEEPPVAEPEATTSEEAKSPISDRKQNSKLVIEPPTMGGTLTANSNPQALEPSTDPLSAPQGEDIATLTHSANLGSSSGTGNPTKLSDIMAQSSSLSSVVDDNQTLEEIEETVSDKSFADNPSSGSDNVVTKPEVDEKTIADLEFAARNAVDDAISASTDYEPPKPIAGLNAQPLDLDLGHADNDNLTNSTSEDSSTASSGNGANSAPTFLVPPDQGQQTNVGNQDSPPPVPPPMLPPFNSSSTASPQE